MLGTINHAVKIVFALLSLNTIVMWLFSSAITPEHNWVCIQCRASMEPGVGQQFLFYSVWSFWMTFLVFVTWILLSQNNPDSNATANPPSAAASRLQLIYNIGFQVALPHVTTVMITYVYYVATNPVDTFLDTEACYHLGRANLGKSFTENMFYANVYLVLMNVQDWTVHYLSAPLLFFLWSTGQANFQTVSWRWLFPSSTLFVIILSSIIAIAQAYWGVILYCGGMWFVLGLFTGINLLFHILFAGGSWMAVGRKNKAVEGMIEYVEACQNGVSDPTTIDVEA